MFLIENLVNEGWLKTPRIIDAFKKVERKDFLPKEIKDLSEIDEALSIGFNQTISQPLVVAFMIELLNPQKGDRVLDIGSGSGWTTALLAEIVGKEGQVIAIERIPQLKKFGENNVSKYNFSNVKFVLGDGSKRYSENYLFNKILISANSSKVYEAWKEELTVGGDLVFPMNSSIWKYHKINNKEFEKEEYPGYIFVPLISE